MATTGTTFTAHELLLPGARVATNLSAKGSYFVKVSAPHADGPAVALCAAATDRPIGILRYGVDGSVTVKAAQVCYAGIVPIVAGAAITAGQRIQTDANGKAIPAAATGYACGQALTSCTADGEVISAAINCASLSLVA